MASLSVHELSFQGRGPYTFAIAAGECVSVAGPSGAGKTLLLRAVADLDAHTGECRVGEDACSTMPAPQWRRLVGLMPAKSAWWFDTVREHFQSYDPDWLGALGFEADVMSWTVSRLSSGEQQRLSLLRVLQNHPQALLLDEPTASLDAENTTRVETLIGRYQHEQHSAILWVTHDNEQAKHVAKRHLTINTNQLLEAGGSTP